MTIVAAAIVTIAALIVIAVSALSYIRAINSFCDIIRERKPPGWERGLFNTPLDGKDGPNPKQIFWYGWIFWLVLGFRTLDVPDDNYSRFLRTARIGLTLCGHMAGVGRDIRLVAPVSHIGEFHSLLNSDRRSCSILTHQRHA